MHPEIVQIGPGSCPKCGMALVPMVPAAGAPEEDAELRHMTRRLWVSAVLTSVAMVAAIATERVTLPLVYALVFMAGVVSAFEGPARQSLLPASRAFRSRPSSFRATRSATSQSSARSASSATASACRGRRAGSDGRSGSLRK